MFFRHRREVRFFEGELACPGLRGIQKCELRTAELRLACSLPCRRLRLAYPPVIHPDIKKLLGVSGLRDFLDEVDTPQFAPFFLCEGRPVVESQAEGVLNAPRLLIELHVPVEIPFPYSLVKAIVEKTLQTSARSHRAGLRGTMTGTAEHFKTGDPERRPVAEWTLWLSILFTTSWHSTRARIPPFVYLVRHMRPFPSRSSLFSSL